MYHFRVIVNTLDIPGTKYQFLPTMLFTHAGLLLENEVFDYGGDGYHRRNLNDCRNEFRLNIRGYPEGRTDVSPDMLDERINETDEWKGNYCIVSHNCHDFVEFCLEKIGNPVKKIGFMFHSLNDINDLLTLGKRNKLYVGGLLIKGFAFFLTGGVEFNFPKIIPSFTKNFCFSNIHFK